jgi:hypothetical protein
MLQPKGSNLSRHNGVNTLYRFGNGNLSDVTLTTGIVYPNSYAIINNIIDYSTFTIDEVNMYLGLYGNFVADKGVSGIKDELRNGY